MRQTVVQCLNASLRTLLQSDPRVVILGEDLLDPYGGAFKVTRGLSTDYPDRVLPTSVSEAAIAGLSAGMAMRGLRPIAEIMFGDFLTLCGDQIVNHIAKYRWMYNEKVEVPLVIRTPMGGRRGYGPTHSQTLEKLFCGVPGIVIVAVNRLVDPGLLLERAVELAEPVLFIENKVLYPQPLLTAGHGVLAGATVRSAEGPFPAAVVGWGDEAEGAALTLVAYGGMSDVVLAAARQLLIDREILCEVVVPSRIKPLDVAPIVSSVQRTGRLIVAEEGTEAHGWGREVIYQTIHASGEVPRFLRSVGARDLPIANSRPLEDRILLQVEDIVRLACAAAADVGPSGEAALA